MIRFAGKYIEKINIHSLKSKMILSIIMLFSLFFSVSLVNNIIASNLIIKKIMYSVTSSVKQTDNYLTFLFSKAKSIGFILSKNAYLESLSCEDMAVDSNFAQRYQNTSKLGTDIGYISEVNEIESVYVYIPNVKIVMTPGFKLYREDYIDTTNDEWIGFGSNDRSVYGWIGHFYDRDISGNNLISFVCRADKLNMDKVESQVNICVNYNERELYKIIEGLKNTPNSKVYMYDSQGSIISCEDKGQLNTSLYEITGNNMINLNSDNLTRIKINRDYYLAIGFRNAVSNWNVLVLIPENELLAENRKNRRVMILLLLIMLIALVFIAVRFILVYIDRPMAKLVMHMGELEKGVFDNEIKEERKDEFGYVFTKYNEMIIKMRNLIKELYQEKLLKREAQLKVLQSQINPHFLYNTLDTINWIAKINNIEKISQMVNALSNLYRSSFNKGLDLIKVKDLLFSIENYIYLQKIRYGNSFKSTIILDERIGEYEVLNLILQPIVENAIIHGLGEKEKDGMLTVTAGLEEDMIVFTVQDNGCGMSKEKLELVNTSLSINGASPYDSGMRNVHKRIRLYYGEKFGIRVESILSGGTTVKVMIPADIDDKQQGGLLL